MALTFSSLTSGEDGDGGASSATGSINPDANCLLVLAVSTGLTDLAAAPSSVTGLSLTWTARGNATISNGNTNIALFSAESVADPGSGALTINYTGITPTNCVWEVVQVLGADIAASDTILQTKARGGTGFSFSNPDLTFDSAVAAADGIFGAWTKNNTTATGTAGGGYVKIGAGNNDGSPSNQIFAQYDAAAGASHDEVFDMTWDSSSGCAGAALTIKELAQDPGGGGGGSETITVTVLDSGNDYGNNSSVETTDAFTPPDNSLVVLFLATGDTTDANANAIATSVTGINLTFTRLGGQQQDVDNDGTGNQRVDIWAAPCTDPAETLIAMYFNVLEPIEGIGWVIAAFEGVDLDDPVVQVKGTSDSGTNVQVTLDAAPDAGNAVIGLATGNTQSPTWSAGSAALLGDLWSESAPANKGVAGWDAAPPSQTFSFTNDGTPKVGLFAVELQAATIPADPINAAASMSGAGSLTGGSPDRLHGAVIRMEGAGTLVADSTQLTVGADISGVALDITGTPVEGITVSAKLRPSGSQGPGTTTITEAMTTTDEAGAWTLRLSLNDLVAPAGSYYVITEHRPRAIQWAVRVAEAATLDEVVDFPGDNRVPALLLVSADKRYVPGDPFDLPLPEPGPGPGPSGARAVLGGLGDVTATATSSVGGHTTLTGQGSVTARGTHTPATGADATGIMYGWHQDGNDPDEIRALETAWGKNFAIVRMFASDDRARPSADALDIANDNAGTRTLMWSVKSTDWAGVAAGTYDSWIADMGADLQGSGAFQVIFIFYHEPHDNFGGSNGSADQWVQAVRRIHDEWHDAGYLFKDGTGGKILIGYCAIKSKVVDDPDPIWDAGNDAEMREIIDVLCHDSYNQIAKPPDQANRLFGSADNVNESWHQLLELSAQFEKPMIISEWGCFAVEKLFKADLTDEDSDPPDRDEECDAWGFDPDLIQRLEGLGYSGDRDGWFDQAAWFMSNDPLAKTWLKGFCYYHARRWMFADTNGAAHLSGCGDDTGDRGGVEGRDGWMRSFVDDPYFKGAAFDPLSATISTPAPNDPPPVPEGSCTSRSWSAGPQLALSSPSQLGQGSGIGASPNHAGFWAIRDDTATAIFYCTETGTPGVFTAVEHTITGSGISNGDFEDVDVATHDGVTYVYVHKNRGNTNIVDPKMLIRVVEPATPGTPGSVATNRVWYWQFPTNLTTNTCPDSHGPATKGGYYNCEAMCVYNGRLYAVRKGKPRAEVYDFGPVNLLSTSQSSPSAPVAYLGTVEHGCPSTFAMSADGRSLLTVSHGTAKVWRGLNGGTGPLACITGELVEQLSLPPVDGKSNNTEGADFWPYGTCDIVIFAESRSTYKFEAD